MEVEVGARLVVRGAPTWLVDWARGRCTHVNPDRDKIGSLRDVVGRLPVGARLFKARAQLRQLEEAPAEYSTWRLEAGALSLPRGVLGDLREAVEVTGLELRVVWSVERPPQFVAWPKISRPLWDHQVRMVEAAVEAESCVLRGWTGMGKTSAGLAIGAELRLPLLAVVWSGALQKQWVERCGVDFGMKPEEVGVLGGGRSRPGRGVVTVAMQQTLRNLPPGDPWLDRFGVCVCDEVDRFAASTFQEVVDRIPARWRIGVSADERRKDRKEFLIYDLFGPVACEVTRDEMIGKGRVVDVEVRLVETSFAPSWYVELEGQEQSLVHDRLIGAMEADRGRNELALRLVQREVDAGRQVLGLSHRVDHCRRMQADASRRGPAGLMLGGKEQEGEFAASVKGFASGRLRAAFGTYQAVGYGIDLPTVEVGVALTPIHSNRTGLRQVTGRLCRAAEGKTGAVLFVLWDVACHGRRPLEQMLRWNRKVTVELASGEVVEGRAHLRRMVEERRAEREVAGG